MIFWLQHSKLNNVLEEYINSCSLSFCNATNNRWYKCGNSPFCHGCSNDNCKVIEKVRAIFQQLTKVFINIVTSNIRIKFQKQLSSNLGSRLSTAFCIQEETVRNMWNSMNQAQLYEWWESGKLSNTICYGYLMFTIPAPTRYKMQ